MRMFAQDKPFCRTLRVEETTCPVALERLRIVKGVDRMRERFTAKAKAFGVSRSTCCDWKTLPLNGGVKAPVPRISRPPAHLGKRWTYANALRAFAIREQMRWCGTPTSPRAPRPHTASCVGIWRPDTSNPAP